MAFVCSTGTRRIPSACAPLICLVLLVFGSFSLTATSTAPGTGPAARTIPPHTVRAETAQHLVVNGAFTGSNLRYTARLSDGSSLPNWISLDPIVGSLTLTPPAAAVGQILHLDVAATDDRQHTVHTQFYVLVDYHRFICQLDANTDRLGRILDCTTGTVQLRGFTSTGTYTWTGPNGFSSTEAEPVVSTPGLYQLATTPPDGSSCPRRSIVEVRNHRNDCETANNRLPRARIVSNLTVAHTNDVIRLHANNSTDLDGEVLTYRWSWDGGVATGPDLTYQFPEGNHEVILTVMDNSGAKSTDRIHLRIDEIPLVADFWLEAECATVGDNWEVIEDTGAAGGSYVTSLLNSASTSAPADLPENHVRFGISTERGGTYHLMARVAARSNQHDSYWVRVNGGSWFKWNNGFKLNAGFQWLRMPQSVALLTGDNTIDFAYREADTRLDKLLLSVNGTLPKGMGEAVASCAPNEPPVARAAADSYLGVAPHTVTLDASRSTDPNDNIARYQWAWNGGGAEGIMTTATLLEGNYEITLTVTDEQGAFATDVVNVQVDPAPPSAENGPSFWLEAECATVGTRWSTVSSATAAGGKYVVVKSGNSMSEAPQDLAANRVRFTINATVANQYDLFARIDAPSNLDDSYYVRINDGEWFKWNSGLKQASGFRWNKLPQQVILREGSNTVDFSFREDGTRLDKLLLSPTKNGTTPTGLGEAAANCGTPADVWLEAECATISGNWKTYTTDQASNTRGIAFSGARGKHPAETGADDRQLTFRLSLAQRATYHLFLRMDAFDRGQNSVWVRVDDGDWIKFWQKVGGTELLTQGYEWLKVNHNGKDRSFELAAGEHTIVIANREAGTRLDKLLLTPSAVAPTGYGGKATGCGGGGTTSREMTMMSFATTPPVSEDPVVDIYPNPVTSALTLNLRDDYEGRVRVRITDMTGRQVRHLTFRKQGTHLTKSIPTAQLPTGMYRLWVVEGDQQYNEPFVKTQP